MGIRSTGSFIKSGANWVMAAAVAVRERNVPGNVRLFTIFLKGGGIAICHISNLFSIRNMTRGTKEMGYNGNNKAEKFIC